MSLKSYPHFLNSPQKTLWMKFPIFSKKLFHSAYLFDIKSL
ncbi:hypothetical protein D927_00528 [Enterococcus faecalis 02-MB-BW-10]|nr:hypothetical protein D927_00528 [Enterococcus faecalis 02-MB-BW-10]